MTGPIRARAAAEHMPGWWFPAAILLTGGPIGGLVGEWAIARRIRRAAPGSA